MPACYEMKIDDRRKYLKRMVDRYWAADRLGRSQLLAEMGAVTTLHRKSLIRLLHEPTLDRQPRVAQRGRVYLPETEDVIRVVWESLDYVCAERLTPSLLATAQHLTRFGELRLTDVIEAQLGEISRATVQRLLGRLTQDSLRLPRRGPEAANRLAREIPTGRIPWQTSEPGHFEVDLVHHCGPATSGEYVHTLQMVDVALGWSERVAVLGRGQRAMEGGFGHILERVPFAIRQLHPDNGPEFLNDHLIRFWGERIVGLRLSRSRANYKNDNRIVEQKNDTLVRAYFGNERLDTLEQCERLNAIYDQMWVYYNLFQPVLHLIDKQRVDGKTKRKWDEARAPYQRLLEIKVLSAEQAAELSRVYLATNPRQLKREIEQMRDRLWDKSEARSGEVLPRSQQDAVVGGQTGRSKPLHEASTPRSLACSAD